MSGVNSEQQFSGLRLDAKRGQLTRDGHLIVGIGAEAPMQPGESGSGLDQYPSYSRFLASRGVGVQVWVDNETVRRACCAITRSVVELRDGVPIDVELGRHAAWSTLLGAPECLYSVRAVTGSLNAQVAFYSWGSAAALCGSGHSGDSACLIMSDHSVAPWSAADASSPEAVLSWLDAQRIPSYRWYHDPAFWRPLTRPEIDAALATSARASIRVRWDRRQRGLAFGDLICFSRSTTRSDALHKLPGLVPGYESALIGSLGGWELELAFFADERIKSVGLTLSLPGLPRNPFEERREHIIKATLENLLLGAGLAAAEDGERLGVGINPDGWGAEIFLNYFYPATKPAAG